jgi:hypothetical protein
MRPLTDLKILPGLHTIKTDREEKGRWKDGDKVRFRHGLPQKLGGWRKIGGVGADQFLGVCRSLMDWLSLSVEKYISLGTHLKLYAWKGGTYYNITPLRASGTLGADPFTTTNGDTTVVVEDVAHGAIVNDYVTFGGAAAVGGITIDGEYQITRILDDDNYEIEHSTPATSTATGGGAAVTYQYEINTGALHSIYGVGWGSGAWGDSTWGTPRIIDNFFATARVWSLDQWGEDLIANPRGKGIYVWDTSVGTGTRATVITNAPSTAKAIMVSPEGQHLIAFGAHDGSADDPLLIRWSSSEDYDTWTAASSNSAGQKRLNTGNEILGGIRGRGEIVVMTDSHLWTMVYTGGTGVFAFKDMGANGGVRGPNAMVEMDGIIYWMGEKDFFYYDGAVHVLPCDVWPTVFDDLNFAQRIKTYAMVNRYFGEIWWYYCSADSNEVDRYVVYTKAVGEHAATWTFGTMVRTAAIGDSDLFAVPFATDSSGYLYEHETGVDDDTAAMVVTLESGDVEIGDGDVQVQIGMVVPDFKVLVGSVSLTMTAKKYPQDSDSQSQAAMTITPTTEYVNPRIKGRQVSIAISSSALSDNWRMGTLRVATRGHGKK